MQYKFSSLCTHPSVIQVFFVSEHSHAYGSALIIRYTPISTPSTTISPIYKITLMQVIHTVIRQMFSGLWVDRNDCVLILDWSSLRDELLVPIAHTNNVRVNFQAEPFVHDGLFVSYRAAVGPYTASDQTQTHHQQQVSHEPPPKKNYQTTR